MRHLLFVEDDAFIRNIVTAFLQNKGYHIEVAINLKMAKEHYNNQTFDLILLDLSLPDGDGFDWAKELAVAPRKTPIIFLTSHTGIADLKKGFEIGGSDYIRKPVEMEELLARIKHILSDFNTGSGQERRIGEYLFNPTSHLLTYKGVSTHLGKLKGSVLCELSETIGRIVLKEDLLVNLWGEANYYTSKNLDSVIVKLRADFKNDERVRFAALKRKGYQLLIHDNPII